MRGKSSSGRTEKTSELLSTGCEFQRMVGYRESYYAPKGWIPNSDPPPKEEVEKGFLRRLFF